MAPLALMVSSCATNPVPIITPIDRPLIDQRILRECLGPVSVPDRILTKAEIVEFYNLNYDRLVDCKERNSELRTQLIKIDLQIEEILKEL